MTVMTAPGSPALASPGNSALAVFGNPDLVQLIAAASPSPPVARRQIALLCSVANRATREQVPSSVTRPSLVGFVLSMCGATADADDEADTADEARIALLIKELDTLPDSWFGTVRSLEWTRRYGPCYSWVELLTAALSVLDTAKSYHLINYIRVRARSFMDKLPFRALSRDPRYLDVALARAALTASPYTGRVLHRSMSGRSYMCLSRSLSEQLSIHMGTLSYCIDHLESTRLHHGMAPHPDTASLRATRMVDRVIRAAAVIEPTDYYSLLVRHGVARCIPAMLGCSEGVAVAYDLTIRPGVGWEIYRDFELRKNIFNSIDISSFVNPMMRKLFSLLKGRCEPQQINDFLIRAVAVAEMNGWTESLAALRRSLQAQDQAQDLE